MYLRKAKAEDIDLLYEYLNDYDLKNNTFSSNKISSEEQTKCFSEELNNINTFLYILFDGDLYIGIISLNCNKNIADIHYHITRCYRGKGYEKPIIQLVEREIYFNISEINIMKANVKKNNVASQLVFEDMDYICSENDKYYEYIKTVNKIEFISSIILSKQGTVILLSNNRNCIALYESLLKKDEEVILISEQIDLITLKNVNPVYCISYNYSYIINEDVINHMNGRICNIHISYLPWNKGSDPNFWSFINNTPKGVTIHRVDKGLDSGKILLQIEVEFNEVIETFKTSYDTLNKMGIQLLINNWDSIKNDTLNDKPQQIGGSYHKHKEFISFTQIHPIDWNMKIKEYKNLL